MAGLVPANAPQGGAGQHPPGQGSVLEPLMNGQGNMGQRARAFAAQPVVKKALPWFVGMAGLGIAALLWATLAPGPQRVLYSSLDDASRASVVATLDQAGIDYTIDNNTGALTVGEDDVYRARMLVASDGSLAAPESGTELIENLPMGASRTLEGDRPRQPVPGQRPPQQPPQLVLQLERRQYRARVVEDLAARVARDLADGGDVAELDVELDCVEHENAVVLFEPVHFASHLEKKEGIEQLRAIAYLADKTGTEEDRKTMAKESLGLLKTLAKVIRGENFDCRLGVMVETPRAALRAGDIASNSAFLSFGTNDLTQMTYGLSRDDAGRFMGAYVNQAVFPEDPFHTLDTEGVGELLRIGVERARASAPNIIVSICGEHGGSPESIAFCRQHGFNYVSCSPFRVPVARLAAAQLAISDQKS